MHMAAMADQACYNSHDDDSDSFESAQPTDEERVYLDTCYAESHATAIASLAKVTEVVDVYASYPQQVEALRLLGNASRNLHSAQPGTVWACRALLAVEEAAAPPSTKGRWTTISLTATTRIHRRQRRHAAWRS